MGLSKFIRPNKPVPEFVIEYYPRTNLYFAKYGDEYLHEERHSGIITLVPNHYGRETSLIIATQSMYEGDARELIKRYKEQSFKEAVLIIKV
jgi:hypothetical protein